MKKATTKRPRGNKTSKAARGARQSKEIELMNQGRTQGEIARELGISRATFWRDITTLTTQYAEGNQSAFSELRKVQVGALLDMAHEVRDGLITAEVGNSVRGFLDSVSRLLGLNAENRRVVAHVSAEIDPEKLIGYRKFCVETRYMDQPTLEKVYAFARTLNVPEPPVVHHPPTEPIPGWDDEDTPRLREGNPDEIA